MLDLLVDPDAFFEHRASDGGGSLQVPALVVGAAALAGIGSPVVVLHLLVESLPAESGYFLVGYAIGLVGALFGPFVEWMLLAIGFDVIARRFGGDGPLHEVVRLVGWGFLPHIVTGLIAMIVMLVVIGRISPPAAPDQVLTFIQSIQGDPAVRLAAGLGIVFTVWSGFLWIFAVKHARGLSFRRAALVVALPVALSIAWRVHQLL